MQEIVVFMLFFGVIAVVLYRFFRKGKDQGCGSCSFNQEANQ
jgi:predicted dithiol-disulfide oxidoreductase (DUF899 family)